MNLEGFFTFTEVKDGLTTPYRVEELVSILRKGNGCPLKNISDSIRQRAAVADAIAATKNKDCLDVFMQLGGLWYIDRWLKGTQELSDDSNSSSIEYLIIASLQALKNLHIDKQMSISSGIWLSVRSLIGHGKSEIRGMATTLFESWKQDRFSESFNNEDNRIDDCKQERILSPEPVKDSSRIKLDAVDVSNSAESGRDDSQAVGVPGAENLPLSDSKETESDGSKNFRNQSDENSIHPPIILNSSETFCRDADHMPLLSTLIHVQDNLHLQESFETSATTNCRQDSAEGQSCVSLQVDQPASRMKCGLTSDSRGELSMVNNQDKKGDRHREQRSLDNSHYRRENSVEGRDDSRSDETVGLRNGSTTASVPGCPSMTDEKQTGTNVNFGILGAPGVVSGVGQEVVTQVVDRGEPFCVSSEKLSARLRHPRGPDSKNGNQELSLKVSMEKVPAEEEGLSAEGYLEGERYIHDSDNPKKGRENGVNDTESSQVTEVAQEPGGITDKVPCSFDLNQEAYSDTTDDAADSISAPATLIGSASQSILAPIFQLKSALGSRGSAATSASTCRLSDSNSSNERKNCPDIDLNMVDVVPVKTGHFQLDLNCNADDADAQPSDTTAREQSFFNHGGQKNPSPASSTSSKHCFDLNSIRHKLINSSDQLPNHIRGSRRSSARGVQESDKAVIYLMGKKVEVNRKDCPPQDALDSPNTNVFDPPRDSHISGARSEFGLATLPPCTYSPILNYTGLTANSGLPFFSTMYTPFSSIPPVMVDSRGVPFIPHVTGSAPPAFSRPPFFLSTTAGLNSSAPMQTGSDAVSVRQFFALSHPMPAAEHSAANSQAFLGPSASRKRKEPDSGLDSYPFTYQQQHHQ